MRCRGERPVESPVEAIRLTSADVEDAPPISNGVASSGQTNIWTNPMSTSFTSLRMKELKDAQANGGDNQPKKKRFSMSPFRPLQKLPEHISKELGKRRLGQGKNLDEKNLKNQLQKNNNTKSPGKSEGKTTAPSRLSLDLTTATVQSNKDKGKDKDKDKKKANDKDKDKDKNKDQDKEKENEDGKGQKKETSKDNGNEEDKEKGKGKDKGNGKIPTRSSFRKKKQA
ncbi:unnamed protein product [Darwinula stevensoni]|uniref:Uncharacterized protein n=1 Tax=Darwinula stevensoni TaxID=69355 RepID=A0A7R9A4I4_9CRUS|nr:unnamed protein product [Darwinula stevensoni]CAG0890104.1 unnamed protein product [Darwinula stevensoni]